MRCANKRNEGKQKNEETDLQRDGESFYEVARAADVERAVRGGVHRDTLERFADGFHQRVEASVAAAVGRQRREKRRAGARLALQRADDVEANHVPGAFPDRVQRRLAVEARHRPLLDVSVAPVRFHGLERHRGGAAAELILAHRRREAAEGVRVGSSPSGVVLGVAPLERRRDAERRRHRGL